MTTPDPRGRVSMYSDDQIRDFALRYWLRNDKKKFPSYLNLVGAGLVCDDTRFYHVITKEWKEAHGIPCRQRHAKEASDNAAPTVGQMAGRLIGGRVKPVKPKKDPPKPGTTAWWLASYRATRWKRPLKHAKATPKQWKGGDATIVKRMRAANAFLKPEEVAK